MNKSTSFFYNPDSDRISWREINEPEMSDEWLPLIVIDPDDEDRVDVLIDILWGDRDPSNRPATWRIQERLREFAEPKPPKPDEPTGLGAVVKDEAGGVWVKWSTLHRANRNWKLHNAGGGDYRTWDDLPRAVKVLSEGVTP